MFKFAGSLGLTKYLRYACTAEGEPSHFTDMPERQLIHTVIVLQPVPRG